MTYKYYLHNYYHLHYISEIRYGKNKNNTSTSFENKIVFHYEVRHDPIRSNIDGNEVSIYQRLSGITSSSGDAIYREYLLEYTPDNVADSFSRLVSVTEKNGSGESLKPTKFNWNTLPTFSREVYPATVNKLASIYPDFADQSFQSADLNGDV